MQRPRCQVEGCDRLAAILGKGPNGDHTYRTRCDACHRAKRLTAPPVGVRPIRAICGSAANPNTTEVIAPKATPIPLPGEDTALSEHHDIEAPRSETLSAQISDQDAEVEGVVVALRMQGVTVRDIGLAIGADTRRVQRILRNARAGGKVNDVLVDLTHQALPAAIEKLLEKIDEGKAWAIKDTLKGLGAFRTYRQQETHRETDELRTLRVSVEMPAHPLVLNPANVVGVPRTRAVEVIDAVPVRSPAEILSLAGGEEGGADEGGRVEVGSGEQGNASPRARHVDSLAGLTAS